jgi:hypothetical protein
MGPDARNWTLEQANCTRLHWHNGHSPCHDWNGQEYLESKETDWYVWCRRIGQKNRAEGGKKMQTRFGIGGVVLVLTAGLAMQTAAACPRESVAAAVEKWTSVFAENNPDTITALYSTDAVLWGTLSPTVRSDSAALKS